MTGDLPMRVVVNGLSAKSGGGLTYLDNLSRAFGQNSDGCEVVFVVTPGTAARLAPPSGRVSYCKLKSPARGGLVRAIWEQVRMPGLLRELRADVVFCPANVDLLWRPCRSVLLIQSIHPFSPWVRDSDRTWRLRLLQRMSKVSIQRADHVVFLSETARRIAAECCQLAAGRTSVVYLGWNAMFNHLAAPEPPIGSEGTLPPRSYLLTVGEYREHKNFLALCEAFAAVCRDLGADVRLVIIGPVGDATYYARVQRAIRRLGLSDVAILLREIPHHRLPPAYVDALAYLQPSYIESFPHTLVEAMGCGCAIGCSTLNAGPEICGDAAVYFDPFDTSAMADTIRRLVSEPALRGELAARALERVRAYSWNRTAAETLELLKRVGGGLPVEREEEAWKNGRTS